MFDNIKPQSLCVIRLSAIGDTCHALAVIRNLQDNWPDVHITWIIGKTEASLLADVPDVEFIIFDKSKGREAYRDIKRQMQGRNFDACLCMHASWRTNWICRLIPTDHLIGFDRKRARDFQWLFTKERIPAAHGEHALDAMMGFARYVGAQPTVMRWDVPVSSEDRAIAAEYCRYPTLVISPCTSERARNYRNWPMDRLAKIAQYARDRYRCRILLTGGNSDLEHEYAHYIDTVVGEDVTNLVGKTTLKQSFAIFEAADLVLCPDSGPAHMATAAGTPVIGLYATSNPGRTGPYVSRQLTVSKYEEALKKYLNKTVDKVRWGQRVRSPDAMSLIDVSDVTEKLDDFFSH